MAFFAAPSLLDLSDDVLLLIFSYLKSHDLISVSQTCERFSKVANDKSLWTIADFSGGRLSLRQLQRCLHFLRDTTLILILRGHRQRYSGTRRVKSPLMSASMLTSIGTKCPNLEELTLVEAYMDAEKLKMIDFAAVKSLKKLSLVNCEMDKLPDLLQEGSYFKGMYKVLPHLETLEIIGCDWLDDFDVMVISKHDKLKRLVLRSSIKVGTAVAYLALSFRFGFQNLEELDMRGTSLKDGEVNSIVHTEKLKALYLGPIGRVRRSDHSHSPHYNLVMSDPRRSEERQQVVVINMRGNRAQWRQVEEEELEGLGLQWVRNAPALRKRNPPEDQDQHYFVGEDGRPINAQNNQARREDKEEENLDQIEEETSSDNEEDNSEERDSSKKSEERIEDEKFYIARDASCSNDIGADHGLSPWEGHQESFIDCPDKDLTDRVIHALGSKTKNLETLVLTGCAITDSGLKEIIRKVPTLKVLDVRGTHVTATGVEEAHVSRPDCIIRGSVAR